MFNKNYEIEGYYLKNYINLNFKEKTCVLEARNKNRKWMLSQDEISLKNHLKWLESLENDRTKLYFLVFKDNCPFMSVSYHDIKFNKGYWGYFLIDEKYRGEVLKIQRLIINFAFERLRLTRLLCIVNNKNRAIKIYKFFGFRQIEKKIINNQEYIIMQLKKSQY